jgi:hypothetical protein
MWFLIVGLLAWLGGYLMGFAFGRLYAIEHFMDPWQNLANEAASHLRLGERYCASFIIERDDEDDDEDGNDDNISPDIMPPATRKQDYQYQ